VTHLIKAGRGLLRRLEGIAAVNEQGGAVPQDRREPGRAGEPGEPGQPLRRGRDIFAQMLIPARNQNSVERLLRHQRAQRGEPIPWGKRAYPRLKTNVVHSPISLRALSLSPAA
jgi:hypothetical protein